MSKKAREALFQVVSRHLENVSGASSSFEGGATDLVNTVELNV
jgi:hypothetical protein